MKAMVLEKSGPVETAPLRWVDLPDPQPGSGEVRLKGR